MCGYVPPAQCVPVSAERGDRCGNFLAYHPNQRGMDRLLFLLAQMECASASWMLAAGEAGACASAIARAVELLAAIRRRRSFAVGKPPGTP